MALNQAQVSGLDTLNKKISSGYTPTATDTANLNFAKQQGYGQPATPTVSPTTTPVTVTNTTVTPPKGVVAISGTQYNTKELQNANFTKIQPVGNTLYGIPKAPIVPDVIPQKDLTNTMTPEKLSTTSENAKGLVQFSDTQKSDLNKAYERQVAGTASDTDKKNIEYAKTKGWQPTTTEEKPAITPVKSTADTLFEKYSDINTVRENAKKEAMKTAGLDEKSQAVATAQSVVNKYRTDLQNQGILDIKEQDVIRAKPILTSQIAGQLEGLSREQKLDTMILQNNYNNALVEQEIAQGNYDRAREIVKETSDDAYTTAKDQIEALKFKNEIEEKTADKMTKELEYERGLAKEGYVLIRSTDGLKGLTEDKIYRDPVSNKIYLKPKPEVATTMEIGGVTYGFDKKGNKIANYGATNKNSTVVPHSDKTGNKSIDVNNVSGLKDSTGNFAKYNTVEESLAATEADITAKQTGNTRTGLNANSSLAQFNSVWTGETNPGYTGRDLAKYLNSNGYKNITENTNIGSIKAKDLTNAVAHFETGYNATGVTPTGEGDFDYARQIIKANPDLSIEELKTGLLEQINNKTLDLSTTELDAILEEAKKSNKKTIEQYKGQGYSTDELVSAGYDPTVVEAVYREGTDNNTPTQGETSSPDKTTKIEEKPSNSIYNTVRSWFGFSPKQSMNERINTLIKK